MEILINGESIPFELEKEKDAFDIVNGIADFALKSAPQHFITSIYIDGKEYSFADEKSLRSKLIQDIKNISFETKDIIGVSLLSIRQIRKFLTFVIKLIDREEVDKEEFLRIKDSVSWMKDGINQIVYLFSDNNSQRFTQLGEKFNNHYTDLNESMSKKTYEDFPLSNNDKKDISINISNIMEILDDFEKIINNSYIVQSEDEVRKSLSVAITQIEDLIPKLSNVPVMFQTGEDKEAMNIIQALAIVLENSINLFIVFKESFKLHLNEYTIQEVDFEDFFNGITDRLKEIMDAIGNNDSIMISDLLEYELLPSVEEIKNILEKIRNEAFINLN